MTQRLLLAALLTLTCARAHAVTANFNALTPGTSYAAPAIFSSGVLEFELLFSLGNLNVSAVSGQVNPSFAGNYLRLTSNTGLNVNLPTGASQIQFDFIRNSPATAVVINGGWLDVTAIPATVNGVSVAHAMPGSNWGSITATGNLSTFFVVGTDFLIDNFTVLPLQGVAGDYSKNDIVDASDVVWLRKSLNSRTGYNSWRSNFGATGGAGTSIGSTNVPEPSTLAILFAALACVTARPNRTPAGCR